MDYLKRAREIEDLIRADRRELHQYPELGLDTPRSSAYIRRQLEAMGLEVHNCGGHGLTAVIGKNTEGPVLLLRADFDALPMTEESGLPFCSLIPGRAHACGHDTHAAMLLGAARMLKENEDALPGRIKLMFQPGEETGDGCLQMLQAGVLQDPAPQAAMGIHLDAAAPLGNVEWGKGPVFCSIDKLNIQVIGKSCHGARPHQGVDPINCASHLILALQSLIAREANPSETDILTICSIESDTKVFNIFPTSVELKGSLRTYSDEQRSQLLARVQQVCEYTGLTFGCRCLCTVSDSSNPVILDIPLEEEMKGYLKHTLGDEIHIPAEPIRKMGSDDVSNLTCLVPSAYFFFGAGPDRSTPYFCGQHTTKVVFNEEVLPLGAAGVAGCAHGWLEAHAK